MYITGIQKLTLLDYPEKTACTVFTPSCNFRCPFCHNASLVLEPKLAFAIDPAEIYSFLEGRVGLLDGVCVTGGEPLLQPDLADFLEKIRSMGFLVKLDTNGSLPDRLSAIIDANLVDYVAMDIKSSPDGYCAAAGVNYDIEKIKRSAALLMEHRVDYEFRTTVVAGIHTTKDFAAIADWLCGDSVYYLQSFRDGGDLIVSRERENPFTAFDDAQMKKLLDIVREKMPNAQLRL